MLSQTQHRKGTNTRLDYTGMDYWTGIFFIFYILWYRAVLLKTYVLMELSPPTGVLFQT